MKMNHNMQRNTCTQVAIKVYNIIKICLNKDETLFHIAEQCRFWLLHTMKMFSQRAFNIRH